MGSKRDHEGYFVQDHRYGAPMPEHLLRSVGLPAAAGRGLFEAPTFTCNHCCAVRVIDRRAESPTWCKGCDHYLCENCGPAYKRTGVCRTFKQIMDEVVERVNRDLPLTNLLQPGR